MKHLLSTAQVEVLAQFAWSNVLLAFDFDGTLAPIVAERDAAELRARTRGLFEQVCRRYPCAVISGRSRDDVRRRLGKAPVRHIVGNHGLEPGPHLARFERLVGLAHPLLERALAGCQGVDLENKRFSLAVHYRRARQKRQARQRVHRAIEGLPMPMRVVPGKLVVNVVPEKAPHKGDALLELRDAEGLDTAIYVGDDVTDEDVFALEQPGRLLSIRVGRSRSSAAAYYLRDQREIDALLALLVDLRREDARRATGR